MISIIIPFIFLHLLLLVSSTRSSSSSRSSKRYSPSILSSINNWLMVHFDTHYNHQHDQDHYRQLIFHLEPSFKISPQTFLISWTSPDPHLSQRFIAMSCCSVYLNHRVRTHDFQNPSCLLNFGINNFPSFLFRSSWSFWTSSWRWFLLSCSILLHPLDPTHLYCQMNQQAT